MIFWGVGFVVALWDGIWWGRGMALVAKYYYCSYRYCDVLKFGKSGLSMGCFMVLRQSNVRIDCRCPTTVRERRWDRCRVLVSEGIYRYLFESQPFQKTLCCRWVIFRAVLVDRDPFLPELERPLASTRAFSDFAVAQGKSL